MEGVFQMKQILLKNYAKYMCWSKNFIKTSNSSKHISLKQYG